MRLKLLLAFFILVSGLNSVEAFAQQGGRPTNKARPRKAPSMTPAYNYNPNPMTDASPAPAEVAPSKYFYVTGLYSSASAIKYKGSADLFGVPTAFSATESTTGALGFAGGYMSRVSGTFGYSSELAYELPRTSSGVEGTLGNQGIHGTYDGNPSNSVLTLAANGNYSFNSSLYIFGGINYPFTSGSGETLNGLPGYQMGAGYLFARHYASELSYRVLRLKGTIESPGLNIRVDEATFSGIILAVQYVF
jgi:hypothetical protein